MNEDLFLKMCDVNTLYYMYSMLRSNSSWKFAYQLYDMNVYDNLNGLSASLLNGTYEPVHASGFLQSERGKTRYIENRCIDDNIVQRAMHEIIIQPIIMRYIISTNSASIPGRGTDFFRTRLVDDLNYHYKHHKNNGYVLLGDFSKFFDNILHDVFIDQMTKILPQDERIITLFTKIVYSNAVNVFYWSDEQIANYRNIIFDKVAHFNIIKNNGYREKDYKPKFIHKSMGIGGQISQDAGIFYPHEIDNYIKIVKGIHCYGRYMDDFYIIHESKELLMEILEYIKLICNKLGIFINFNKTQIVNLKHEFSILKTRYKLLENGKVIIIPNNGTFNRECKSLKYYHNHADEYNQEALKTFVIQSYKTWKGTIYKRSNGKDLKALKEVDELYMRLFNDISLPQEELYTLDDTYFINNLYY